MGHSEDLLISTSLLSGRVAWQMGLGDLGKRAAWHTDHTDLLLKSALQLACSQIFASKIFLASKMTFLKLGGFFLAVKQG